MLDDESHKQIIIVRRRSNGDEGHHGGVWKIAFADFMTAMMAFFLVLWIVNSTSKETQASIARYFNPMKMSDTTPAPRGMQNPKATDYDASFVENVKEIQRAQSLESLMKIKLPVDVAAQMNTHQIGSSVDEEAATSGKTRALERIEALIRINGEATINAIIDIALKQWPSDASIGRRDPDSLSVHPDSLVASTFPSPPRLEDASQTSESTHPLTGTEPPRLIQNGINALALSLQNVIDRLPTALRLNSAIRVDELRGEVVLSIIDSPTVNMFARGSAVPLLAAVEFIGSVGVALKALQLNIAIRGHTDAMQYRRGVSDNWKLSSDRALSAFYILKRFGVAEERIRRIEGVADRELRNPQSPFAHENRRIEIVLTVSP